MNATQEMGLTKSEAARDAFERREGRPWFRADWAPALFVHYEVPAAVLQPSVPLPLDCREGKAYVTLVAFSFFNFRIRGLGAPGEWLCRPFLSSRFFNVRTYVRGREGPGIYFLTEFLSNRITVPLGPPSFGLPYRHGRLDYHCAPELRSFRAELALREDRFAMTARREGKPWAEAAPGSLTEFLLERYVAYTRCGNTSRFFRIWHEPWLQDECEVEVGPLPEAFGPWVGDARCVGANLSPGAQQVWLGLPRVVGEPKAGPRNG